MIKNTPQKIKGFEVDVFAEQAIKVIENAFDVKMSEQ